MGVAAVAEDWGLGIEVERTNIVRAVGARVLRTGKMHLVGGVFRDANVEVRDWTCAPEGRDMES